MQLRIVFLSLTPVANNQLSIRSHIANPGTPAPRRSPLVHPLSIPVAVMYEVRQLWGQQAWHPKGDPSQTDGPLGSRAAGRPGWSIQLGKEPPKYVSA